MAAPHHEPSNCARCGLALEKFTGRDPLFPVDVFICPRCRTVYRCGCSRCELLVAAAYGV